MRKVTLPLLTSPPGSCGAAAEPSSCGQQSQMCDVPPTPPKGPLGYSPAGAAASTNLSSSAAAAGSSLLSLPVVKLPKAEAQPIPTSLKPAPESLRPPFLDTPVFPRGGKILS